MCSVFRDGSRRLGGVDDKAASEDLRDPAGVGDRFQGVRLEQNQVRGLAGFNRPDPIRSARASARAFCKVPHRSAPVLATRQDGVTRQRRREPFPDRDPPRGSRDHAMTRIGAAGPVGDEMFFYHGGYARGRKLEPATERRIGLPRMKLDRYLAWYRAGTKGGS